MLDHIRNIAALIIGLGIIAFAIFVCAPHMKTNFWALLGVCILGPIGAILVGAIASEYGSDDYDYD